MSDKNVFERDVEIPEIVQKKADLAFSQIYERKDEEVMKKSNKKIIRFAGIMAAVAAVAAVLAGTGFFAGRNKVPGAENVFAIKVCAAELKGGSFLPLSLNASDRQFYYGIDWEGNAVYGINIPVTIEGENIESVTYKLNNACFEVVSIDGPSVVKNGLANNDAHEDATYSEGYDIAGQYLGDTIVEYYDSFTMDYDVQRDSKYVINIVDSISDRNDLFTLLSNDVNDDFTCSALTYMLKDEVMTAEVTFSDGTTSSKRLGLFAKTYSTTDVDTDGNEYNYTAMGIFCYDIDDIDEATKSFINDQISGCEIYCFEDGAPSAEEGSEYIETSDFGDFDKFNIPGFNSFFQLGNDVSEGIVLEKSGKEFRIIPGPEDEVGYADISLKYGDCIEENITSGECIVDNIIVEKDENTAYAILILGEGGEVCCTEVYELGESGIIKLESYNYANYDFPNLQNR